MAKRRNILREYDDGVESYSNFTEKLRGLVGEIIATTGIQVHSIGARTKGRASLEKKLRSRGAKYSNIADITDICGIRVITYFEDDVDKVATAIESEFNIDQENSVDKRALLDPDRFGYLSLHYVVSLPTRRAELLEYRRFTGLKAEIQVRSILQHAWAEIEHDLGYKTALGIPRNIRREFSRLAGLLEIADREFTGIRDRLTEYEREVLGAIEKNPANVLIDKPSLSAFVKIDNTVNDLDKGLGKALGVPVSAIDEGLLEWYANHLQVVGITNLGQLRNALLENAETIIRYGEEWVKAGSSWHGPVESLGGAVCLMYLILILAAESGDSTVALKIFRAVRVRKENYEEFFAEVRRIVGLARQSPTN